MGSKSPLRQVPSRTVAREWACCGVQGRARDESGLLSCGVAQGEKEGQVLTGVRSRGMILC